MSSEAMNQTKASLHAGYANSKQQLQIWSKLHRGAKVSWCPDPRAARLLYGVVDCESVVRPGWYYVRDEENTLHLVNWGLLLANTI